MTQLQLAIARRQMNQSQIFFHQFVMMISEVKEGDYIDFKDNNTYEWQVGLVLFVDNSHLKVRSEGWSSKYDENIPITSDRIKQFRSRVRGYTGQQRSPAVREHWKYSTSDHEQRTKRFKLFKETSNHTKEEWNQFCRGEHYFYIDFLMSQTYKNNEELKKTYEYFQAHVQYAKSYLEKWLQTSSEDWFTEKGHNAEREAYYEIFEGVYIITGLYPRHSNFYKSNQRYILQVSDNCNHDRYISKIIKESDLDLVYLLAINVIDRQFIKPLPVSFLYSFYKMFLAVEKGLVYRVEEGHFAKEERKKVAVRLIEILIRNIEQTTSEHLKFTQTQKEVETLLTDIFTISFRYGVEKKVSQWIKRMKVKFSSMLLETDSIERRLKGISKLKQLLEATLSKSEYTLYQLPAEELILLMRQARVLQKIFMGNQHPEMAKKGAQLWLAFFKNGLVPFQQLEFIWQHCISKHQSVRKITLQLWMDLIPIAKDKIAQLARRIVQRYNHASTNFAQEWEIGMLTNFSEHFLKYCHQEKVQDQEVTAVGKEIIMVCYQDLLKAKQSSELSQKIAKFAKLINYSDDFNGIIKQAYVQVAKGSQLKFHLQLLLHLYSNASRPQTFLAKNAVSIILSALDNSPADCEPVFKLLTQVIHFSFEWVEQQIFSLPQFQALWRVSHKHAEVTSAFHKWLLREHHNPLTGTDSYEINSAISQQMRSDIFKKCLCDFGKVDYINLSLQQFNAFRQFLLDCNLREHRLEITYFAGMIRVIKVKDEEIIGIKYVWDIFMNCKDHHVLINLNQLIIVLYLHCESACTEKARLNKLNALMAKIDKNLKDGYRKGNYRILKASLELLSAVIDFCKQIPEGKAKNIGQHYKFTHTINFKGTIFQLQTSYSCSYKQLKQKISEMLKIELVRLRLLDSKKKVLGFEYGGMPFCFMQEKQIEVIEIPAEEKPAIALILEFVSAKIEASLIQMIEDEQISQNVYDLWKDLEVQESQVQSFIGKLTNSIVTKRNKSKEPNRTKSEIYSLLLILRLMQNLEEKLFIKIIVANSSIILDLISLLGSKIVSLQMLQLLASSTIMVLKLVKVIKSGTCLHQGLKIVGEMAEDICQRSAKEIYILAEARATKQIKDDENIRIAKISLNCLNAIEAIKGVSTLNFLFSHAEFIETVKLIYLTDALSTSRIIVTQKIKKILKTADESQCRIQEELEDLLMDLFCGKLYPLVRQHDGYYSQQKSTTYFYGLIAFLISRCIKSSFHRHILNANFYKGILGELTQLRDQPQEPACNYILKSHLQICCSIFEKDSTLFTNQLVENVFYEHLFYLEGKTQAKNVSCLRKDTIGSCLKAILAGCKESNEATGKVLECLREFQQREYWKVEDSWAVEADLDKKQRFKGLQNPGCICFMNSLLQQLFMNKFFNSCLLTTNYPDQDASYELLRQMKRLFLQMVFSEQSTLSSLPFAGAIRTVDHKPMISIYNQMDIDQFSNILFDRIQQQLLSLGQEDFVKKIFGGTYAQQIVSHQCPHSSEREQDFLSIGLEVKKSISDGLASLIKGQMLDGQNKYYCQRCDLKVKAEKILTIKRLPQCLIIALKRFQFNFDYDAKVKINNYCQFPQELNLRQYTQQEVLAHLLGNHDSNLLQKTNQNQDDQEFQYRLKGVVIHMGSADSGHYYSIIKDSNGQWIEFNDSVISNFNVETLPEEAFGSKDELDNNNKNAYLLFYEKVHSNFLSYPLEKVVQNPQNRQIVNEIESTNKRIEKSRVLFSSDYSQFIENLWINIFSNENQSKFRTSFKRLLIQYYLQVRIRQSCLEGFVLFSKKISNLLIEDPQARDLFLQKAKEIEFQEDFYVYCSIRSKCGVISHLLADNFTSYLKQNPDSLCQDKGLLFQIIQNAVNLTVLYGNINELNKAIRIILQKLEKRHDYSVHDLLLQKEFDKISLSELFGKECSKQKKSAIIKDRNLRIIKTGFHDTRGDKRQITPIKLQSWRVLELLVSYAKTKLEFDGQTALANILDSELATVTFHRIIHEARTHRAIVCCYSILKTLNLIPKVLPSLEKGLKDFQSTKYRSLLLFCYEIIKDKSTSEQLLKDMVQIIEKMLVINDKYFLESNLILQWTVKFVDASELFRKAIQEKGQVLNRMIGWIEKHRKPSSDLVKKHKNPLNERLLNRIEGIMVTADPNSYEQKSLNMEKFFSKLLNNAYQPQETAQDQPTSQEYRKVGQDVKVFSIASATYKYGTITDKQFGNITVKLQGKPSTIEIQEDDELLMPLTQAQFSQRINNTRE